MTNQITQNESVNCTSSSSSSSSSVSMEQILLPLLYFENRGTPLTIHVTTNTCTDGTATKKEEDNDKEVLELPAEIVQQLLTSYATWGDLFKLSIVQKEWKTIVNDTAQQTMDAKWNLSQALLYGTNGVVARPWKALQYLHELASTITSTMSTTSTAVLVPTSATSDNSETIAIKSMKLLAKLYLEGCGGTTGTTSTTTTTTTVPTTTTTTDDVDVDVNETIQINTDSGLEWLQRCYYAGDSESAYEIALIYEYGKYDVPIDVIQAFEWFSKAANSGHVEAMVELGLCYELGCGVVQNDTVALDWYMKAAEYGHCTAKFSIGEAFEEARGVPQSDEEACIWYYKAAIDGCEDSRIALRRLEDIARIVIPGAARALLLESY